MANLKEKINEDIKNAMKAHEELKLSTLRMLNATIHNRVIEKKTKGAEPELTEEEIIAAIRSEVKKRKDAVWEFEKAGRKELAEKESAEAKILEAYLPAELDDGSIEKIVKEVIAGFGTPTSKEFGKVMGEAMKRLKGKASGERVGGIIKKHLL